LLFRHCAALRGGHCYLSFLPMPPRPAMVTNIS
jgi:hypothetical protein